jgi:VCBS repeat-containing protein
VTFTPSLNFNGAASFSYTTSDGTDASAPVTVTVNVAAVNDAPVAVADTLAATEDTPVTYTAADLLGNDTDVDNTNAQLSIASVTSGTGGTAVLNGDGTVTFTPSLNFNGAASFSYTTSDGTDASAPVTVTVNVAAVNDAAIITGETSGAVIEAGGVANAIPGAPTATGDLSATDVDNATDSFQAVAAGAVSANGYGTYGVTAAGVWTYTLDNTNDAVQALNNGGSLNDTFTVLSEDGTAQVATITINGADDVIFTENANTVNFNAVIAGTYVAGTQYDALGGDDIVTLPDSDLLASRAGFDSTRTFFGGAGNDNITGGDLDDIIDGGPGNDFINGGAGTDTASYASAGSDDGGVMVLMDRGEAYDNTSGDIDTLVSIENVTGSAFDDLLIGNNVKNVLDGGAGSDSLFGDAGDDFLFGGAGDDFLFGEAGNDTLVGEAGNDTLVGGAGDDLLFADAGDDIFDYNALSDAGPVGDLIQSFGQQGMDHLDLRGLLSSIGAPHDSTAFSGFLRTTTDSFGDTLVEVDSTGGGLSWQPLVTVTGFELTLTDFIL